MSTEDRPFGSDEICGAEADGCVCTLDVHPRGVPHACGLFFLDVRCKALWRGTWNTDTFEPVRFQNGEPA